MIELLTERDKELIKSYIKSFASNNEDNKMDINLEKVLQYWDVEKSKFLGKMFNNQLILKRFFTYKMPIEGLEREYNNLCGNDDSSILDEARAWLKNIWLLKDFDIDTDLFAYEYISILSKETLINNSYNGQSFMIYKNGIKKPLKISSGMKPMRIIHSIAELFDKDFITPDPQTNRSKFDELCIWHSKIFNQANMDGELCLSIHPLDYMTMSDNNNNWDSCMTWTRPKAGEYRAGTIECMNSPYIIVAYLHNPKHTMTKQSILNKKNNRYEQCGHTLPDDWEWNSKRWRELFLVQDNTILEIKGYPYQDEVLSNAALMWIKELAYNNLGWEYNDEEMNIQDFYDIDKNNFYSVTTDCTYFMYNDVGTLPKHRMRVNLEKLREKCEDLDKDDGFYESCMRDYSIHSNRWHHIYTIPYGGYGTCVCCGGYLEEEENNTSTVICEYCEPYQVCPNCGARIVDEDDMYYVNNSDDPICYSCWENNTQIDDITGESYLDDDCSLTTINWAPITDKNGNCIIDYTNSPWFYDNGFITYEPATNTYYDEIFNQKPKTCYDKYRVYHYVTTDMIKNMQEFKRLFGIYGESVEKIADIFQKDYLDMLEQVQH